MKKFLQTCIAAVLLLVFAHPAHALWMGGPGFAPDKSDLTLAGMLGYRALDLHSGKTFDTVKMFELGGDATWMPLHWLQSGVQFGVSAVSRTSTDFKGDIMPNVGASIGFIPVRKETVGGAKIALHVDFAGRWQPLAGTRPDPDTDGRRQDATGTLWEAVAGASASFCTDRLCGYGGGRYSYFRLYESGAGIRAVNKHLGGIYAGVDYFVTPAIYFSIEAQNFDGDAIYGGVGGRF